MEKKKSASSRRTYDSEFRSDVLKMVFNGRSVAEVSESLGIRENLIHQWKKRYKQASGSIGQSAENTDIKFVSLEEYEQLKARLRVAEQERDILKKALGIFSQGT